MGDMLFILRKNRILRRPGEDSKTNSRNQVLWVAREVKVINNLDGKKGRGEVGRNALAGLRGIGHGLVRQPSGTFI